LKICNIIALERILYLVLLACLASFFSCKVTKVPPPFFSRSLDTTRIDTLTSIYQRIQKGDLLDIQIYSDNPGTTELYNQVGRNAGSAAIAPTRGGATLNTPVGVGYLVDQDGNVQIHGLGRVKAEGLTILQLQQKINESFVALGVLKNPYSLVRFNNFKVTVVGEVTAPGIFTIPSGRVTVFDALGMAGDINVFGKRTDVILVREEEGRRSYAYLDLTDPNVFRSSNYYLRQNDLLIVQAGKEKIDPNQQNRLQTYSLVVAAISSVAIVISIFR